MVLRSSSLVHPRKEVKAVTEDITNLMEVVRERKQNCSVVGGFK